MFVVFCCSLRRPPCRGRCPLIPETVPILFRPFLFMVGRICMLSRIRTRMCSRSFCLFVFDRVFTVIREPAACLLFLLFAPTSCVHVFGSVHGSSVHVPACLCHFGSRAREHFPKTPPSHYLLGAFLRLTQT